MNAEEGTDTPSKATAISCGASSGQTFCVAVHIIALFTGFIGPLLILLFSQRDLARQHSRAAFNWQISLTIYILIPILFLFLFPRESQSAALLNVFLFSIIGISILVLILLLYDIIVCVIAASKASQGIVWRYPLSLPILKVNCEMTQITQQDKD